MGTTIWVLGEQSSDAGDDFDHSAIFDAADGLDALCQQLGVPEISSFFDWTDFNANMGDEDFDESPRWFDAGTALATFQALRAHLASQPDSAPGGGENCAPLLEELDDCIEKVKSLAERSEAFHLCVVM